MTDQTDSPSPGGGDTATAADARRALAVWCGLLVLSVAVSVLVVVAARHRGEAAMGVAGWLVFGWAVAWLLLGVPAALVLRSHCFRLPWQGLKVEADSYLRGMLTVWGALVIGWMLSLLAVAVSGAVLPGLLPAGLAAMLLALTPPSGSAMAKV